MHVGLWGLALVVVVFVSWARHRHLAPRGWKEWGGVVEGPVPADVLRQRVHEAPEGVVGPAVRGVPAGSPGMESTHPQPSVVYALRSDGRRAAYARR